MKNQICTKCGEEKPLSEFYFRKDSGKYRNECKECFDSVKKQYYIKNRDKINKQKNEKYHNEYKFNKIMIEKKKLSNIKFKQEKPDYNKQYYQRNKDKFYKESKKYREEHKEQCDAYYLKYRIKHKDKLKNRRKSRYDLDINYKIKILLRIRINLALKQNFKSGHTLRLLGCSVEELKQYIESQFKEGMSWDNHSQFGWHIDHIKPCASFDLSDPEQQKRCFHYTNLQPLWWYENLSKGKNDYN